MSMRPVLWVDPMICQSCERCQARGVCKTRAIVQIDAGDPPIIERARCRGCQVCLNACPWGAIGSAEFRNTGQQG